MSLKMMLEEAVAQYGEKTAIISGDQRLSYAYLNEASNRMANTLTDMGIRKGDRVATLLTNSPEFVISYFGIFKIGGVVVPLDVGYTIDELTALFDNSQPKALMAETTPLQALTPALPRFSSIKHVIEVGDKGGQFTSYQEVMTSNPVWQSQTRLESDDLALIAYTSGPSLRPRGVMLHHGGLITETIIAANGFQQTDKDIVMLYALPIHHMFGLVAVLLGSLYKGSTVVIVPGTGLSFNIFMEAIEREKGTMFMGVPYIFALAIEIAEKEGIKNDLSSLRLCASAGAPLRLDIIKRFKQLYGFDLIDFWGLTEATCHVTCSPVDGSGKIGSVGKALPGWEVKVVDDRGTELPPTEVGEVIITGPMMKGYYNNPQATAETIKDGWLHTGDLGQLDEDGYLFLTGRKKETIILKGQNIYPSEIESVLRMHPGIADAAVIGIADELRGEIIGAVITLKEGEMATEHEIKQFCAEHTASFKVPKQVMFLNPIPKTTSGKIDKEGIRSQLSIPSPFPG
jgi:long-chain acyl-CoA synthetase